MRLSGGDKEADGSTEKTDNDAKGVNCLSGMPIHRKLLVIRFRSVRVRSRGVWRKSAKPSV